MKQRHHITFAHSKNPVYWQVDSDSYLMIMLHLKMLRSTFTSQICYVLWKQYSHYKERKVQYGAACFDSLC